MSGGPCRVLGCPSSLGRGCVCRLLRGRSGRDLGSHAGRFAGKSRNCAFLGETLTGRVQLTVVAGAPLRGARASRCTGATFPDTLCERRTCSPASASGARPSAREVVFNTGMTGYQEIATDPPTRADGHLHLPDDRQLRGLRPPARIGRRAFAGHHRARVKNTAWNATCPEPWWIG